MIEMLSQYRQGIESALRRCTMHHVGQFARVSDWGSDLSTRLDSFVSRGKLIRGSLVLATYDAFGGEDPSNAYAVAAALELVQSFLLIHDDIMDQDPIRRGEPTVYEQYRRLAVRDGHSDPARFGESMGICAGDVSMLLSFSVLAELDLPPATALRIVSLVAREIADVGVAQMSDVANGHMDSRATEDEILAVYRYKTGRYTFSVPMMLGAILAGRQEAEVERVGEWGELQGLVFQIRDDHIGLMSEEQVSGKPEGSDILADKQTLHRLELLKRVPGTEYADVAALFGARELRAGDINRVRDALRNSGTLESIDQKVGELRQTAGEIARAIEGLTASGRETLKNLDLYNATRTV